MMIDKNYILKLKQLINLSEYYNALYTNYMQIRKSYAKAMRENNVDLTIIKTEISNLNFELADIEVQIESLENDIKQFSRCIETL